MKRKNNHGEGGHVCPSFLQRKHNRECTLRKRRKKRHRRNQSRRRVWEWKWKFLLNQVNPKNAMRSFGTFVSKIDWSKSDSLRELFRSFEHLGTEKIYAL